MDQETAQRLVDSKAHWHQKFEIFPGVMTPGSYDTNWILNRARWPVDMRGMRVLEIGACDGSFTLELSRRGADVVAVDYMSRHFSGFSVMEAVTEKNFDHRNCNLYQIEKLELGLFDLVVFYGVLYHLPDMMLALSLLRRHCKGRISLETYVEHFNGDIPAARYYRGKELVGDITNFWAPNPACVTGMLVDTGFKIDWVDTWGDRILIEAAIDDSPEALLKMNTANGLLLTGKE